RTFNPSYPFFNLQVIWAIGICMIVLSGMIYMKRSFILAAGIVIIAFHNLLDNIHVTGNNLSSFAWAILHESGSFAFGRFTFFIHYPVLPWIGIMAIGYYFGSLYSFTYNPEKRKIILLSIGVGAIIMFLFLRLGNFYGDPSKWTVQRDTVFT